MYQCLVKILIAKFGVEKGFFNFLWKQSAREKLVMLIAFKVCDINSISNHLTESGLFSTFIEQKYLHIFWWGEIFSLIWDPADPIPRLRLSYILVELFHSVNILFSNCWTSKNSTMQVISYFHQFLNLFWSPSYHVSPKKRGHWSSCLGCRMLVV